MRIPRLKRQGPRASPSIQNRCFSELIRSVLFSAGSPAGASSLSDVPNFWQKILSFFGVRRA